MDTETNYTIQVERKTFLDSLLYFQHRKINNLLNKLAEEYDKPDFTILEIGTGTKALVHKKLFKSAHFIASDIAKNENIDQVIDVTKSGALDTESYDLILCMNVLEHLPNPQKAIDIMYQGLKNPGQLFIVTPFLFPIHDPPYDFYRYSEYALKKMMGSFSQVSIKKVHVFTKRGLFDRFVLYYITQALK